MKVKILLLYSNPSRNLDLADEHREILKVINDSDIEIITIPACRIEDFIEALNKYKPNIIHFTGHGNEQGELLFTKNNGGGFDPMSKELLKKLLNVTSDNVKLFFLDACYSEIQAKVISSEIDYVIGMNRAITEDSATEFATRFYNFFASGASIRESFEQAKVVLIHKYPYEGDIPNLLFRNEDIADVAVSTLLESPLILNDKLKTDELYEVVKNLHYSAEKLRKWAYSVVPKELNLILGDSIEDMLYALNYGEDVKNPCNIPIICFAMKIYNESANKDVLKWIESAKKSYSQLKDSEPNCIEVLLDSSHNIIIDIDPKNKDLSRTNILIWEDKDDRVDKVDYKIVQTHNNINLEDKEIIRKFLDELKGYLQKFSNPFGIVLEFVLPMEFLYLDIKLWEDSEHIRLPKKYPIVFRFRERFVNFSKYEKQWISHWNMTYMNNKSKTFNETAEYLEDSIDIDAYTAEENACVVITSPLNPIQVQPILDNGISIIIFPQNFTNSEDLERFNRWFENKFQETAIETSIRAVNKIFARKYKSFESNMILVWDNPNNIPKNNQYSF